MGRGMVIAASLGGGVVKARDVGLIQGQLIAHAEQVRIIGEAVWRELRSEDLAPGRACKPVP